MTETFGEMLDTSPEQRARYFAHLRTLTPEQRLRIVGGLTRAVRTMARTGIRRDFPNASEREVDVRLAVRLYGPALARRAFGEPPADAQ